MVTRLFIRDDDVGEYSPSFERFFRTFADRRLPVSYQIIPERLTAECANFLLTEQRRTPDLVDFGQHGLRHQMMVRGRLESYEFGPERTYAQQHGDIRAGRAMLRELLGDVSIKVFTPPRHRYDRNTLRALAAEGFSVFSASSYPGARHRLAYAAGRAFGLTNLGRPGVPYHGRIRPDCGLYELSIAVAADDGGNIAGPVAVLSSAIDRARSQTQDVGIMLHHQAYREPAAAAHLEALADVLANLPDATFHTIGALHDARAEV